MCGRFTYRRTLAETRELFAASVELDFSPRYNIAPTQQVLAVGQTRAGERKAVLLRWGLILSWTREIPTKTFNVSDWGGGPPKDDSRWRFGRT